MSEISLDRITTTARYAYHAVQPTTLAVPRLEGHPILNLYRLQGSYETLSKFEKAALKELCPTLHKVTKVKDSGYPGTVDLGYSPDGVRETLEAMRVELDTLTRELKDSWPFIEANLTAWFSSVERRQNEAQDEMFAKKAMKTTCPICGNEAASEAGNRSHIKACINRWKAQNAIILKDYPEAEVVISEDSSHRGLVPIMRTKRREATYADKVYFVNKNGKVEYRTLGYGDNPYPKMRWQDARFLACDWISEKEYHVLVEKENREYRERRARELAERRAKEALSN